MLNTYVTKILNILRFFLYQIIDLVLKCSKQTKHPKTLLIIRLDAIGDYILIRNIFQSLKQSKIFKDYNVTLCGNVVWKDLAETFDKDVFDNFIWVNRKKFNNNIFYKYKLLKIIYESGFEVVIDTTFSREILYGDCIVKSSKAIESIGSVGAQDAYVRWKRNLFTDKYYSKLVRQSNKNIFEFYRNKDFFENVLQEKIDLIKPVLECSNIIIKLPTKKKFAVIFPGAQEKGRRWSYLNFEVIIDHLFHKYDLDVIIAGSSSDSIISQKMVKCHTSKTCFDMTGKTTLPQLAKLISLSKILISNETSAVHFASAVVVPFVCVSNGNHFGRFNPYPEEMNVKGKYIYPDEIEKNIIDFEFLSNKYRYESNLDINSITPSKVMTAVEKLL